MQGYPIKAGEKRALPSQFKLLPEYLKKLNYSTHLVGKWHQGFQHWNNTPTYKGFDSFLGYYNGYIGYFTHDITMGGYKPKTQGEIVSTVYTKTKTPFWGMLYLFGYETKTWWYVFW